MELPRGVCLDPADCLVWARQGCRTTYPHCSPLVPREPGPEVGRWGLEKPEGQLQPPLLLCIPWPVGMEPGPGDLDWETLATNRGF